MAEKIVAGIVLALCAAMLLRMALGEPRRQRLDAAWRRWLSALRRGVGRRTRRERRRVPPAGPPQADAEGAAREADAAIRRAQRRARNADRSGTGRGKPH